MPMPVNLLDYSGNPDAPEYRSSLAFSDQGAWFAYGFSNEPQRFGFTGPFLMTQGQGEWCSEMLSGLELINARTNTRLNPKDFTIQQRSYLSHLEQVSESEDLRIEQYLFFSSPHSAIVHTRITNLSDERIALSPSWSGTLFDTGLSISTTKEKVYLNTDRSPAKGIIQLFGNQINYIRHQNSFHTIVQDDLALDPDSSQSWTLGQTFIFPEYDLSAEQKALGLAAKAPEESLDRRIKEKQDQLVRLYNKLALRWQGIPYENLVAKSLLTLQNNTRIAAGELKHSGLFPSYHYKWFLGFWAWDSWKHAVPISQYDTELAKNQVRSMYDFQDDHGFIADCVYRDTTIEKHNYRNTKPPLSGWAVWKVYEQDRDLSFLREMYPKVMLQHQWWYNYRDHDQDGICEYGSTDGSLKAAKWESGMDNAVRFDGSAIVQNSDGAFSLNQESVDLNAYLYAEKQFLIKIGEVLEKSDDVRKFQSQSETLKKKIQSQFFDQKTGWFYDTSLNGDTYIDVMGSEGWIPLWAEVATADQAEAVKANMMRPDFFNTKMPFQTLSAVHPEFEPNGGYWRGPTWMDQAYFGVKGLHNYGYEEEAYAATHKLLHNASGTLDLGTPIRENYDPITGEGLESQSFSWSAAHYLLLLQARP